MMTTYEQVLVAIDVFSDYKEVVAKAVQIADSPNTISLVYVCYPQANFEPYGLFLEKDFTDEVRGQATDKLKQIAADFAIPTNQIKVAIGSPSEEIHAYADEINADLIVLGTHGQSGLQLLLGSTCNSVLHGVKCDVLAVKV